MLQVLTTTAQLEDAQRIAERLVADRLAACVQIEAPIRSLYRWDNQVQDDTEYRLTAKTTRDRFPTLCACLEEIHPYDVPEIIATLVIAGSPAYLQWVAEQVSE
ncbi:Divalent-cation tolerance protein CutA [Roseimaritima ulvae]|uniref:Divalent-cation tolerance protein CutA n=1 Tax=Roseimaritima ulvae TaxID=980254 RepID=A0A5B9QQ07_9BACT|nr:Divalent-cation tolerance protein CutA [Roseimaritima ulvae]